MNGNHLKSHKQFKKQKKLIDRNKHYTTFYRNKMILTTKNELIFFVVKTYPVILTLCCQTHVTYDTVEGLVNNAPTQIMTKSNWKQLLHCKRKTVP